MNYDDFIASKAQLRNDGGFEPLFMPSFLFDFQAALLDWAIRKGRAAILADCGLGKTPMQLVWGENVVRHLNRPVLILTPLSVSSQTIREAERFDIGCQRASGSPSSAGIYVTNYERLHQLNPDDFGGVVCDESSILKAFDGTTRAAVTEFMRRIPYRLLATATPAPNDYVELGTSAEALGHLGFMDMLSRFFKNNRNTSSTKPLGRGADRIPQWRFRGHAERPFWRWVSSWARAVRRPSDMGFDDSRFALPPLLEHEHVVAADKPRPGFLFVVPAHGLAEERAERRLTLTDRCEKAAALVADTGRPAVNWCHLNDEADMVTRLVPGAIQVSGRDSDEEKEEKFEAFATGQARVLVTKPIIGAWGLNWQHCAHMTAFAGHSFEQYYQSVRRFWRFGQKQTVTVDHVVSEGERGVMLNLQRKMRQADAMFAELVANVGGELALARTQHAFTVEERIPSWL